MWKYHSLKIEKKIVEQKDNLAYATYEPVIADIKIRVVDINNNEINIIYKPDNKFGIIKQVARYENEDLKNLLKKIMKLLDNEN